MSDAIALNSPDILADVRREEVFESKNQSHFGNTAQQRRSEATPRRTPVPTSATSLPRATSTWGALRSNLRKSGSTKPRHTFWISAAYSNGSAGLISFARLSWRTTPTSTSPSSQAIRRHGVAHRIAGGLPSHHQRESLQALPEPISHIDRVMPAIETQSPALHCASAFRVTVVDEEFMPTFPTGPFVTKSTATGHHS